MQIDTSQPYGPARSQHDWLSSKSTMDVIAVCSGERVIEFKSAVIVTDSNDGGEDENEMLRAIKIYNREVKKTCISRKELQFKIQEWWKHFIHSRIKQGEINKIFDALHKGAGFDYHILSLLRIKWLQ